MSGPPARPETIRQYNKSLLLQEIHRDGALTRAELTQRLGLSRSTIGALVAELAELSVIQESIPTGGTRAGRPSHVVGPHEQGPYVVAADVDVTQVLTAAVGIGGTVLATRQTPLAGVPHSPEQVATLIAEAVGLLQADAGQADPPRAVGVSVPGTVHRQTGTVGFAPNLEWRDAAFAELVAERLVNPLPVSVGNDADLSMLAEHVRGAARGARDAVFLIGRFGVGAGIIVNGAPLHGRDGHAGEIGHNVVDAGGPTCHCGKRGCLETYVGSAALVTAAGRVGEDPTTAATEVLREAGEGEPAAVAAVRHVARSLGRAVAGLVNTLNPELVVLGGTLADVLALAPDQLHEALSYHALEPPSSELRIIGPGLGSDSAVLGAAELALADILADPAGRHTPVA